jgi:ankyrin repeat protein
MVMAEKVRLSAKEVIADVRAGATDEFLLKKYSISEKGLRSLFQKLIDASLITQADLDKRTADRSKLNNASFTQTPEPDEKSRITPKEDEHNADAPRMAEALKSIGAIVNHVAGSGPKAVFTKYRFHVAGLLVLIIVIGLIICVRSLLKYNELPPEVIEKLSSLMVEKYGVHEKDDFPQYQIIKAKKGIPTQKQKDEINPKAIYCLRLAVEKEDIDPFIFDMIVAERQSGDLQTLSEGLTVHVFDPSDIKRGYNQCPDSWENVCPFSCGGAEKIKISQDLRAKIRAAKENERASKDAREAEELERKGLALLQTKGVTALMIASSEGRHVDVEMLLTKGAAVNAMDNDGLTALMVASSKSHARIVGLLLAHGADIKMVDNRGRGPLMYSILFNQIVVTRLLLDKGADINYIDSQHLTPLMVASMENRLEIVKLLVARGADIHAQNGSWPLMFASSRGHLEIVAFLLNKGAYVDFRDRDGRTSLMVACANGNNEIAKLLLDRGACIDETDYVNRTALMHACLKSKPEVVKLLLDKGADTSIKDKTGHTAFTYAAENPVIRNLLIARGVQ